MGSVELTVTFQVGKSVAPSATAMLNTNVRASTSSKLNDLQVGNEARSTVGVQLAARIGERRLNNGVILLLAVGVFRCENKTYLYFDLTHNWNMMVSRGWALT